MDYYIEKPSGSIKTSLILPSSKSISSRTLIIRALCCKSFPIRNLSDAGDTRDMMRILSDAPDNSKSSSGFVLYNTGDGGTTFRFLTAYFAACPGKRVILTGSDEMNRRPVGPLVTALKKLGAEILYLDKEGFPPLQITGKGFEGGDIVMDGSVSSQFISAILMIAPCCSKGISLKVTGRVVSLPYITMTILLMKHFGIHVKITPSSALNTRSPITNLQIKVPFSSYKPKPISIEPDWSAASFWYEIVALNERASVKLTGLRKGSLQGDSEAASLFEPLGVATKYSKGGIYITKKKTHAVQLKTPLKKNFTDHPDLAIPFAMTCAGLNIHALITGISNLAIKESNRIEALITEINKTGCRAMKKDKETIEIFPRKEADDLSGLPGTRSEPLDFDSHNDHRMAMALAPLAVKLGKIKIKNGWVVRKSYPGFWEDLKRAGFILKNNGT